MSFAISSAASRSSAPSSEAGNARVTISPPDARAAASAPGNEHTTIVPPARAAAWLASSGAPTMPIEPPTTSTPADHLCALIPRLGNARSAMSRACRCVTPVGMPMSTTVTRPARDRPGSKHKPGFNAAKQIVSSARTASPRTSPVVPSTPDGMSTASVRAPRIGARRRSMRCLRAHRGSPSRTSRRSRDEIASALASGSRR